MKYIVVVAFFTFSFVLQKPTHQEENRYVYGVRISTGANSQMLSFIAKRYDGMGNLKAQRIYSDKDEFIKVVAGFWPSPFNPSKTNYFELYQVFGGVYVNDTINAKISYCPALDSLWKIRFSEWPHHGYNEPGWSLSKFRPSLEQESYLSKRYNIKELDFEFIVDTNFFKLLQDVSNPEWIAAYKSLY